MKTKGQMPELRFPEFYSAWDSNRLGNRASFTKGKGISKADINENGNLPCIRYGELYTHYGTVIDEILSFTNGDVSSLVLSEGDEVLMPASGETAIDIATASVIKQKGVALGGDLNIIKSDIDGAFLAHYLSGRNKTRIARLAQGISVIHLYSSQLKLLELAIPSLKEQRKIATFLAAVDAKLDALRRKRALLAEYKRGVMQKLFTQEIRFVRDDDTPYPNWEDRELGEILSYQQPTNYLVSSTEYDDIFDTPVLTAGKTFVLGYTDEKDGIFKEFLPAIIFDDFTTASKYVDFPFKAKSSAMKILTSSESTTQIKVVYEFMQLLNFSVGSHKRHWISVYQFLAIPFPSLQEQQKIAEFLTAIDNKITAVDQQISQMATFKKGLLQQMFV
ncbi:MAG TPA: restriction endonuclease subunit S [candidate division Zixibacteria bacterium]|nr:restriction endonuclease subunit S [candidate division Zixibacteria bacterium]